MIKCIVCDLDETLLNEKSQIPSNNIKAIQRAKEKGIKFVPATGRHFQAIASILKELDLWEKENEYVLSLNGALLSENAQSTVLSSICMDHKSALACLNYGFKKDVCMEIYTTKHIYMIHPRDDEMQVFEDYGIEYTLLDSLDDLKDESFLKIIYENKDMDYLRSLEKDVLEQAHVFLSYSSNRYMELNAYGVNKGEGVKKLCEVLNLSLDEVMAIGDHFNDVSMLEVAGLSCAVSNAQQGVKDICDVVLEKSNREGGVSEAIERFVLGG